MTYPERLAAMVHAMESAPVAMNEAVARELDRMRSDDSDAYTEAHALTAHAAADILRAHFAAIHASMTVAERIEWVRTMPNYQPDVVRRAENDAVTRILDRLYPDAAEYALDRLEATNADPDTFCVELAKQYAASARYADEFGPASTTTRA